MLQVPSLKSLAQEVSSEIDTLARTEAIPKVEIFASFMNEVLKPRSANYSRKSDHANSFDNDTEFDQVDEEEYDQTNDNCGTESNNNNDETDNETDNEGTNEETNSNE
jgi:hypothetical protein